MLNLEFYKNKNVLITGHTGFKGTWMCVMLAQAGAKVTGIGLKPPTTPNLFDLSGIKGDICSIEGDIRDFELLKGIFEKTQPEIVIHMAAQPIVRESYKNPVYTYEVNVMGTVNVMECVRLCPSVRSVVNVTTDKVYMNKEWEWGYRENEELNGFDPYSNSKSCSELVTSSYKNSFFGAKDGEAKKAVSTARAGNVIGGGDFAVDRIIPDCIRAAKNKQEIIVRNPYSIRPYQHVLEPIAVYLLIAQKQYEDATYEGSYNVGPDEADCYQTGELVSCFCKKWSQITGEKIQWKSEWDGGPHEANFLKLDCSRLKAKFGWKPVWNVERALEMLIEWYWAYLNGQDIRELMDKQIMLFLKEHKPE